MYTSPLVDTWHSKNQDITLQNEFFFDKPQLTVGNKLGAHDINILEDKSHIFIYSAQRKISESAEFLLSFPVIHFENKSKYTPSILHRSLKHTTPSKRTTPANLMCVNSEPSALFPSYACTSKSLVSHFCLGTRLIKAQGISG